jgi:hypothetical protein
LSVSMEHGVNPVSCILVFVLIVLVLSKTLISRRRGWSDQGNEKLSALILHCGCCVRLLSVVVLLFCLASVNISLNKFL